MHPNNNEIWNTNSVRKAHAEELQKNATFHGAKGEYDFSVLRQNYDSPTIKEDGDDVDPIDDTRS